jgi:shikimate dehydrogenase
LSKRFGLVGVNIGISLSPQIHRSFFDCEYELFDCDESSLAEKLAKKDFDALNVTVPYKKTVMPFLDVISEKAREIGSVNTVVNKNGVLYGYNTDYFGFVKTVEKLDVSLKGKKALVLGSGGASLAVRAALRDMGAGEVITVSRTGENNYSNISRHFDASLIVNTTPVGKYPDNFCTPLCPDGFERLEAAIDINYNPVRSRFLLEAQERGAKISGGLTMLVWQAKRSAELFTGLAVDDFKAQETENRLLSQMQNIVLIGMPSAGKSTVGRILAEMTGREFFDTDLLIEKAENRSPADIINASGEEVFRQKESEQILRVSKNTGAVTAVGGGAVLKPENVMYLRQNGILVYIKRPLAELTGEGRPLSRNIEALFEKRKPLYEKYADVTVCSQPTAEQTAEEILRQLGM